MAQLVMGLAAALVGLAGGGLSGLFGIGGGIVMIPLLGLLLHVGQHQAQGMTLALMLLPNSLPAVLHYRRQGYPILWPVVLPLMAGFLLGGFGGAELANRIPAVPMRLIFSLFLGFMALRQFLAAAGPRKERTAAHQPSQVTLLAAGIGLVGGLASGLLGIGGAIVMIPLMTWLLGLRQHEAQLASLTLLLPPLGLPAVIVYVQNQGPLPWMTLAFVAAGFLMGSHVGARFATRLRGPRLRRLFAVLLGFIAMLMIWRALA